MCSERALLGRSAHYRHERVRLVKLPDRGVVAEGNVWGLQKQNKQNTHTHIDDDDDDTLL